MAEYTIDKIEYDGNVYKLQDNVSGYIKVDTDTKVNMIQRGTTKSYLLGTTTAPTASNQAVTSVAETGVYFDTTAATLVATTFKGALTGTASGNLTSSSTLNAAKLSGTVPSGCYTNTTYTFANGTNGFKVTPAGGTEQTVTVTPSITNNVTGSGTSGQLAQWNGTNTLTSGPKITYSTSTPSGGSNGDIWFVIG